MLPTMLPTMPYLCCCYTSIYALNLYLCLIYKSTMNIYEHYIINTLIYAFNAIYISITHINLITPLQMNNVFIPWEFFKSDVNLIWTYMENNADGWWTDYKNHVFLIVILINITHCFQATLITAVAIYPDQLHYTHTFLQALWRVPYTYEMVAASICTVDTQDYPQKLILSILRIGDIH